MTKISDVDISLVRAFAYSGQCPVNDISEVASVTILTPDGAFWPRYEFRDGVVAEIRWARMLNFDRWGCTQPYRPEIKLFDMYGEIEVPVEALLPMLAKYRVHQYSNALPPYLQEALQSYRSYHDANSRAG